MSAVDHECLLHLSLPSPAVRQRKSNRKTMKVFLAIALTLALFATSLADEDKRANVLHFYECISCSEDQAARDEYIKCAELKPEKCKKIAEECKATLLPDLSPDECWGAMCKNEDEVREKMYDCIMNNETRKDLSEDEKTQLKEFLQCAKKVDKKFCEHP